MWAMKRMLRVPPLGKQGGDGGTGTPGWMLDQSQVCCSEPQNLYARTFQFWSGKHCQRGSAVAVRTAKGEKLVVQQEFSHDGVALGRSLRDYSDGNPKGYLKAEPVLERNSHPMKAVVGRTMGPCDAWDPNPHSCDYILPDKTKGALQM